MEIALSGHFYFSLCGRRRKVADAITLKAMNKRKPFTYQYFPTFSPDYFELLNEPSYSDANHYTWLSSRGSRVLLPQLSLKKPSKSSFSCLFSLIRTIHFRVIFIPEKRCKITPLSQVFSRLRTAGFNLAANMINDRLFLFIVRLFVVRVL